MSFCEVIEDMKGLTYVATLIVLVVPLVLIAAVGEGPSNLQFTFDNPLGNNVKDLNTFLKLLLTFVTQLATPIIVLMLIYTGFLFIRAQGNPDKISEARRILLWTLVGAGIILGANALLYAISGTVDQIRRTTGMYEALSSYLLS